MLELLYFSGHLLYNFILIIVHIWCLIIKLISLSVSHLLINIKNLLLKPFVIKLLLLQKVSLLPILTFTVENHILRHDVLLLSVLVKHVLKQNVIWRAHMALDVIPIPKTRGRLEVPRVLL